jgi:hypothetical protein
MGDKDKVVLPANRDRASFKAPSAEMLRIRNKCAELWNIIQGIRKHPPDAEVKNSTAFFGKIRLLSELVALLHEQPGVRPGDALGDRERARYKPLKEKMDQIQEKLNKTVHLEDPLPYTSPKRVEWVRTETEKLATILLAPDVAKDLEAVGADKTLSLETKNVFFDWVGVQLNEALSEVAKSKDHEVRVFDAVSRTLDSHEKSTAIGACLWLGQTSASAAGNLPGPNSLYVGFIRVRAIHALREVRVKPPNSDLVPHLTKALRFSDNDAKEFEKALAEFVEKQGKAKAATGTERELLLREAEKIFDDKLKQSVRNLGSPQAGAGVSALLTLLDLVCLAVAWASLPDDATASWSAVGDNIFALADTVGAGLAAASGAYVTTIRLLRLRSATTWLEKAEYAGIGKAVGFYLALIACAEGLNAIGKEFAKADRDVWKITAGVFQVASGVAIGVGVCFALPGAQLVGVTLGLASGLVILVEDASKEPMAEFLETLLTQLKDQKTDWDSKKIADNVGISGLLDDLEKLMTSIGVTRLTYDPEWKEHGVPVGRDRVFDRLNYVGISEPEQRARLLKRP